MRRVRAVFSAILALAMVASAVPAYAASAQTFSVTFSDASHGFMAGGDLANPANGFISATDDGGATWHSLRLPSNRLESVATTDGSLALAVKGSDSSDRAIRASLPATGTATWSWTSAIFGWPSTELGEVAALAGGRFAVVGRKPNTVNGSLGLIATSDDAGGSWQTRLLGPVYPPLGDGSPAQTYARMTALGAAPDGMTAWAVGREDSNLSGTWKATRLYTTTDAGSTWTTQSALNVSTTFNDVAAFDANHAVAVGAFGTIQVTSGSLAGFSARTVASAFSYDFLGAAWPDAATVVVVGQVSASKDGVVFRSTDGGATFTEVALPGGRTAGRALRAVEARSATDLVAVGDDETVLTSADGGATWTVRSAALADPVLALLAPAASAVLTGSVATISGTASDAGVGVASVTLGIQRDDGVYWTGSAWTPTPTDLVAGTADGWQHWTYAWTLDPFQNREHSYTVTAKATDGLGRASATATASGLRVANADTPPAGATLVVRRDPSVPLARRRLSTRSWTLVDGVSLEASGTALEVTRIRARIALSATQASGVPVLVRFFLDDGDGRFDARKDIVLGSAAAVANGDVLSASDLSLALTQTGSAGAKRVWIAALSRERKRTAGPALWLGTALDPADAFSGTAAAVELPGGVALVSPGGGRTLQLR